MYYQIDTLDCDSSSNILYSEFTQIQDTVTAFVFLVDMTGTRGYFAAYTSQQYAFKGHLN